MKFKYIGEEETKGYGWEAKSGEVIEVRDAIAWKLEANELYEKVVNNSKVTARSLAPLPEEKAKQFEIENQQLREDNAKLDQENKRLKSQVKSLEQRLR